MGKVEVALKPSEKHIIFLSVIYIHVLLPLSQRRDLNLDLMIYMNVLPSELPDNHI